MKEPGTLKEHEKFWAFSLLGGSVLILALLAFFHPIPEGSSNLRIVDAALGGLLLAFGGAANALFRISSSEERQDIGRAAVRAMNDSTSGAPQEVTVTNTAENPVPADIVSATPEVSNGELPADQKL